MRVRAPARASKTSHRNDRPEAPGDLRDFAQKWAPQRHSARRDQCGQLATRQVQALAQGLVRIRFALALLSENQEVLVGKKS
jgi:hypothetical protein